MRVLALLFAFYFTVLGCLPCSDEELCAEVTHVTIIKAAHTGCGTSHGSIDWCSPLCQCHCCAGFALPTAPALGFSVRPVASHVAQHFAARPTPAVLGRALAAPWQPPQEA